MIFESYNGIKNVFQLSQHIFEQIAYEFFDFWDLMNNLSTDDILKNKSKIANRKYFSS
jgi:hypothetical protein